jgi:hypothetical protein
MRLLPLAMLKWYEQPNPLHSRIIINVAWPNSKRESQIGASEQNGLGVDPFLGTYTDVSSPQTPVSPRYEPPPNMVFRLS